MFGLPIEEAIAYCGWRAILKNGYVDILPDRSSIRGDDDATDALLDAVNQGPWKRMLKWAKDVSGSSFDLFEEFMAPNMVLRACPNASYGYLYIGLGMLPEPENQDGRETSITLGETH